MDAWQGAGAFGEVVAGGSRFLARLLRSSAAGSGSAAPAGARLMPCPRGAFSGLRFVPHERQAPAAGEVKVRPSCIHCLHVCAGSAGGAEVGGPRPTRLRMFRVSQVCTTEQNLLHVFAWSKAGGRFCIMRSCTGLLQRSTPS